VPVEVRTIDTRILFLINLVQDVAVVQSLVRLCARSLDKPIVLFVSDGFRTRDIDGRWGGELARLAAETGATLVNYSGVSGADAILRNGAGVLIAASESDLPPHRETHQAMQSASGRYLKITLQHGFECVGFLQGRGHDLAHGTDVRFAADVLAGWMPSDRLTALHRAERDKLMVTGPTTWIEPKPPSRQEWAGGLIAENLQSPRLLLPEPFDARFAMTFADFFELQAIADRKVTLRPHPTGMGLCRTFPHLVTTIEIDSGSADTLGRFRWAITPPSSVVFDLIRAGVPVAVWNGESAAFDTRHYQGLMQVGNATEWTAFADAASGDGRRAILARQEAFVERLAIPKDSAEVSAAFTRLISAGLTGSRIVQPRLTPVSRIAVVTDVPNAALDMQLVGALQPLADSGVLSFDVHALSLGNDAGAERVAAALDTRPVDAVVFCGYSGAERAEIIAMARARGIAAVGFPLGATTFGIAAAATPAPSDARIIGCFGERQSGACLAELAVALENHADVRVEFVGMPVPESLAPFGTRIVALPRVRPLRALIETIRARGWTIGIAQDGGLVDWLTLAAGGVAPLMGEGHSYGGLPGGAATGGDAEVGRGALSVLLADDHVRMAAARAAQDHIEAHFSLSGVRAAVNDILREHNLRLPDGRRVVQSLSRAA
jgi:hypothetical protein